MSCGQIDFLEGGTLQNVTIMGGQISSALIQGCALDSCNLTHLRDIDTASAELIAKALMNLPAATLAALARVLYKACEDNSDCCCCQRIVPPPFSRSLVPPPPTPVAVVPSDDNTTSDEGEGAGDTETGQGTVSSSPHCGCCMMPPPPPPLQPVVIISGGDDDEEESDEGNGNG